MRPEEEFLKFIVDEFARLVIVTLYLVDDNPTSLSISRWG